MACFESVEMELPEGSVIAAYTDGLIESREADIDVGLKRLSFALARTGITLDDLCSEVIDTMTMTTPSQDDVALLLARTRSLGFEWVVSCRLPSGPILSVSVAVVFGS